MEESSNETESTRKTTFSKPSLPEKHRIHTISELYLLNRQEMLSCTDEYQYYRRLMESISIGASLLPPCPIVEEAKLALKNKSNYPEKRNMSWMDSRSVYSCSSGEGDTGKVTVRPEELETGEISLRNQQCNMIIQHLAPLDREIFSLLMEHGVLRKKTLDEEVESSIMKELLW